MYVLGGYKNSWRCFHLYNLKHAAISKYETEMYSA